MSVTFAGWAALATDPMIAAKPIDRTNAAPMDDAFFDTQLLLEREGSLLASVVTTVHQLGDAEKIANRLLLLAEGRRIAWGTLESLRAEAELPDGSLEDVFVSLTGRHLEDETPKVPAA